MNTYHLKKIREKYQILYKNGMIYLVDHKNQTIENQYTTVSLFMKDFVSDNLSTSYLTYCRKIQKRLDIKRKRDLYKVIVKNSNFTVK